MCGRYTFTFSAPSLAEAFGMIPYGFDVITGHNISPGRYVIIVRPEKSQVVPDVAFWGLIPGWVTAAAIAIFCDDDLGFLDLL